MENFWLEKARTALNFRGNDEELLEKMRVPVAQLSDLFTIARPEKFQDYMSVPALLAAYGLFFFPQSFARADFAAKRLLGFHNRVLKNFAGTPKLRILDIGSGAAPCALAIAKNLRERVPAGTKIELVCVDRSRFALDAAHELAAKFGYDFRGVPADLSNLPPLQFDAQFDFISLGWSLNEIVPANGPEPVERALVFLKKLAPALKSTGTLVVFEPALKSTAERLQRVADFFVRNPGLPFHRIAPELGPHVDPLLATGTQEMWTHDVRRWDVPATLEFINRKLFREIDALKFSWSAFAKSPAKLPEIPAGTLGFFRLVSPIEITKPALRFAVVDAAGTRLQIEFPTRGMSKSDCKKLAAKFQRGDILTLSGTLTQLGGNANFRLAGTLDFVA